MPERAAKSEKVARRASHDARFRAFVEANVSEHKVAGYGIVTVSLKPIGKPPGDASADQIDALADLAEEYSQDELRVSHEQNIILPYVALDDLPAVYDRLSSVGLSTPNAGLVSDIIACPGLDYCALATARSIPIAERISERFGDGARARDIGPLKIKISGCINACGHHHVGHIGILGLERAGEETYQITLGGSGDETAAIGQITGPGFSSDDVVDAIETIVETYKGLRNGESEDFPHRVPPRRHGAVQGGAVRPQRQIGHLMSAHDVRLFGDQVAASRVEGKFARLDAQSLLRLAIKGLYPGRIALVSSFGADSAVLLHMVAEIDKATPVVFVDTGQHFPETLAYRDRACRASRPDQRSLLNCLRPRSWPRRIRRISCLLPTRTAAATSERSIRWPRRWRLMRRGSPAARRSSRPRARHCRCSRPRASG